MATPSQKVIIPKGLVNPYETTIIEIPKKLQNKPAVVARPKTSYLGNRHKFCNGNDNNNNNTSSNQDNYYAQMQRQREQFLNYMKLTMAKNSKYSNERGDVKYPINNNNYYSNVQNAKYAYYNNVDEQKGDNEDVASENSNNSIKETADRVINKF